MSKSRSGTVITGYHAIEEYLRSLRGRTQGTLYLEHAAKRSRKLEVPATKWGIQVTRVSRDELRKIAGGAARHEALVLGSSSVDSQGATASARAHGGNVSGAKDYTDVAEFLSAMSLSAMSKKSILVLALDGVTDPHNLGAVLRSAEQFGADMVMLPERRSARMNETVAKTSAGAAAHVPLLQTTNLGRALGELKEAGFWVYGAEAGGTSLSGMAFPDRVVLVLGSEGKGMGRLVREVCDEFVAIPTLGRLDSLNVSVACGVLCYEVRRSQGLLV